MGVIKTVRIKTSKTNRRRRKSKIKHRCFLNKYIYIWQKGWSNVLNDNGLAHGHVERSRGINPPTPEPQWNKASLNVACSSSLIGPLSVSWRSHDIAMKCKRRQERCVQGPSAGGGLNGEHWCEARRRGVEERRRRGGGEERRRIGEEMG